MDSTVKSQTKELYEEHHTVKNRYGFSLLADERANILRKEIGVGKNVLDIGCRDGTLTRYFINGNKVTGVDVDANSLELFNKNLGAETIEMDLSGDWHKLHDRKFDVIFAGEVLEHVFHPDRIIEKISKHLNLKGIFLGSVPNAFSLKNRLRYLCGSKKYTPLSDPTHVNQFSVNDLKKVLSEHFNNVKIIGLGRFKRLSKLSPNLFSYDIFFKAWNS